MNIALIVRSDRGDLYLPRMRESLDALVPDVFKQRITIDDREHRLGLSGAINEAWGQLRDDIDYCFDVEEDFIFTRPVPVENMARSLECNPRLAQLSLKRGPVTPEEHTAGGFVELHPDEYEDHPSWLEHRRLFSLNPCVYPARITGLGWPAGGGEREFTDLLLPLGFSFGVWGSRAEMPVVEHIGHERAPGWRL